MKNLGKVAIFMTAVMLLATSCRHRILHISERNLRVVFEWDDAADAKPKSMAVYFFPKDASKETERFTFRHVNNGKLNPWTMEGGDIIIPEGVYDILCVNTGADYLIYPEVENATFDNFIISTGTLSSIFSGNSIGVRSGGTSSERLAHYPDQLWCDYFADVHVFDYETAKEGNDPGDGVALELDSKGVQLLKLFPKSAVTEVSIEVEGVKNIGSAVSMAGTVSGMAGGFVVGHGTMSQEKVTIPFNMSRPGVVKADDDENGVTLTAKFYTFGHCPVAAGEHKLELTFVLDDETVVTYPTYDEATGVWTPFDGRVTTMLHNETPNGIVVKIEESHIILPVTSSQGGGFQPSVEDWEEVEDVIIGL